MKVILTDDVKGLGHRGDVVTVAAGLRPELPPPEGARLSRDAGQREAARAGEEALRRPHGETRRTRPTAVAKSIEGAKIVLHKKAGEHDALYGSVTSSELAEALAAKGITVDKRKIDLEEPIKRLGDAHGPRQAPPRRDRRPHGRGPVPDGLARPRTRRQPGGPPSGPASAAAAGELRGVGDA